MAISAALPLEAALPPAVLGFNHKAQNALQYQVSAQTGNALLNISDSPTLLGPVLTESHSRIFFRVE